MNAIKIVFKLIINCINRLILRLNGIILPKDAKIFGLIRVKTGNSAVFKCGKNFIVRSSWRNNPSGGGQIRTLLNINGELIIGNNVGISNSSIVCHNRIVMEDNVFIGVNCVICDSDCHSVNYEMRVSGHDSDIQTAPVVIKNGAWIGGHCIVLKGVTIGERAVIGAGSVVTKNIPNDEIWAGNPVHFIKKNGGNNE